jgi:CDP-diacylglycerol--glycerol-3-phosphate 3-phosphatidyltransferase
VTDPLRPDDNGDGAGPPRETPLRDAIARGSAATADRAEQFRTAAVAAAAAHPPPPDPIGDPISTVSNWNIANGLTLVRLLLVPVFAWVLFRHHAESTAWRIGAWGVFVLAAVTDRADGELARRRQLITELGKLADPIADKALIGTALVGLSMLDRLPWWVTIVILARELGVTGLRFWVIRHGVIPASRGGKAKTLLQSVAIGLYVLPLSGPLHVVAQIFMAAALVMTILTGGDYVARAVALRRTGRVASAA